MSTKSRSRSTRTRAELAEDLSEIKLTTSSRESQDPKTLELQRRQDQETRQAAASLTVQKTAQKIAQVGIDIQGSVAKVSEQLMETTQELSTVQRAVELEREELEELHGKDVVASSIQDLLAQHAEQQKVLDSSIVLKRQQWQEEQSLHLKEQKAYQENLVLVRQRDEDEHQYATAQRRRTDQDKYDQEWRAKDRQNREKQELLEKGWTIREETIKSREKEFTDTQAKVLALETDKKGLESSVNALGAQLRDTKHAFALEKAGFDQKLALSEQRNQSLDVANKTLADQVIKLQTQLDAAREQVKEIATKSVEGASGRLALSELKDTLTAQNGGPQQRGKS